MRCNLPPCSAGECPGGMLAVEKDEVPLFMLWERVRIFVQVECRERPATGGRRCSRRRGGVAWVYRRGPSGYTAPARANGAQKKGWSKSRRTADMALCRLAL